MMKLNLKKGILLSLILAAFHIIPAIQDWVKVGLPNDNVLLISVPIWLTFFFVGPFWVYYFLNNTPPIKRQNKIVRGLLYVVLMSIGARIVAELHFIAFPYWEFDTFNQMFSALIWGIFFFTLWEFYCLQYRLEQERFLRKQVELNNLTNQLNPHFLFNGLNTISSLMLHNVDKADNVLHKFADILRYSLDKKDALIDLQTEIEICQFYLDVEKERFGENLCVTWQIGSVLSKYKVPPLLFQPLLENVLKHAAVKPLRLHISLKSAGEQLEITIRDNGVGFSPEILEDQGFGTGLQLVYERLSLLNLGTLNLYNDGGAVQLLRLKQA